MHIPPEVGADLLCSNPRCEPCTARRRRRELVHAALAAGALGAFLVCMFLLAFLQWGAR